MPQGSVIAVNRTIDDEFGDLATGLHPIYTPDEFWSLVCLFQEQSNVFTHRQDSTCETCVLHPNPALAFNGTWHDSSQFTNTTPVSVTLQFSGTGIYVFCIVPPVLPGVVSRYRLNYTLDSSGSSGTPTTGNFSLDPISRTDYTYNLPVVSMSGLSNGAHTLLVSTNDASVFLFDYAVYTTQQLESAPTTSHHTSTAVIAAATVFGVLALVAIPLVLFLVLRLRRRQVKTPVAMNVDGIAPLASEVREHRRPTAGVRVPLTPQRFRGHGNGNGYGWQTPPPVYVFAVE
ncbi:hypothetical protein C8F01DRAFT_1368151 [Mycena amicta]|nr:hypothetical protein C8F01DRAFT_1368151 [Mycena amicta]